MTRLALVNAIYFKGNWMHRFDEANTKEMDFKVTKVKTNAHIKSFDLRLILKTDVPDNLSVFPVCVC